MTAITQMNIWDKYLLRSDDIVLGLKYNYAKRDLIIGGPRKFRTHVQHIFEFYLPDNKVFATAYGYNTYRMQTKLGNDSYMKLLKAIKEVWVVEESSNFLGVMR